MWEGGGGAFTHNNHCIIAKAKKTNPTNCITLLPQITLFSPSFKIPTTKQLSSPHKHHPAIVSRATHVIQRSPY